MLRRLATSGDRRRGALPPGPRDPYGRRTGRRSRRGLLLALRIGAQRRGHGNARLDGLVEVAQRELERAEERDDVLQRHEPEMRHADELAFQLPLAPGHDRVVVVTQDSYEI